MLNVQTYPSIYSKISFTIYLCYNVFNICLKDEKKESIEASIKQGNGDFQQRHFAVLL